MDFLNSSFQEEQLYIKGMELPGVQSVNTTFEYPEEEVTAMGYSATIASSQNAPLKGGLEINRFIVCKEDPITGMFEGGMSGHLNYSDNKSFIFQSGLIENYSVSCTLDEIPSVNCEIQTWGKVGGYIGEVESKPNEEELVVPSPGDIDIVIDNCAGGSNLNAETNAVRTFDYSIEVDWQAIKVLGNQDPADFFVRYPIYIRAYLEIEINDFVPPDFIDTLCQPIYKDLTLRINKCSPMCEEKSLIRQFSLPNAKLVSFDQYSDIDDVLVATLGFKSTIQNIGSVGKLLY
jgi:hypothetical protein